MSIPLAVSLVMTLILATCSTTEPEAPDRMINIGTHQLHAVVLGAGSPPVVIDAGIGGRTQEWRVLQERLAAATTVLTYDRAGYGRSEPGPLPRDSGTEADELKLLLSALSLPGPYVLVGHSLGGLNLQVYADRYPDDVAAMVLLDPPPLSWLLGDAYQDLRELAGRMTDEWQGVAEAGLGSGDPQRSREAAFFQMLASEHREVFGRSAHLANRIETFGDVPLTVIASAVPNPAFATEADGYQEFWIEQSRNVAARSSRGRLVVAQQSTHQLHVDAADLVERTILSAVADARNR